MTTKLYKRIALLVATMLVSVTVAACGNTTTAPAPAAATTA
ncbi:MAG: hypothetical protein JWP00_4123, partial [Chloroflexi bacterium]|nr:hypothetical protein [Chloroflexota bacterium]